ncbi:Egl nine-like 1 [Papilio machaon]|uniref:Egl nine-like 1 n=1 Tax=Papilio machaon TaxID=76193 RepID=A0A194RKR4_PAPMA|nr:Egl nine-like 1 [Papilio machaon]
MNQESVLVCCAVCSEKTHRRCARCLNIYYCNTEHQRQDWRRHKTECVSKLPKQASNNVKAVQQSSPTNEKFEKVVKKDISKEESETAKQEGSEVRQLKKSKRKNVKKEGSVETNESKPLQTSKGDDESVESDLKAGPSDLKDSVISSVVYTNRDLTKQSAIIHEGSSEQEILNESAQQLSTVDFVTATTNVLKTVNRTNAKMPPIPVYVPETHSKMKEYPEASLKGSGAFMMNNYYGDTNDPSYEICQRVIRDMTQYGVCVLDNFLGKDRGLLVLNEVLEMYRSGIFTAGQLVSSPASTEAQTIRSDRITWIDGKEPHCFYIKQLISQVDKIILQANKMPNNGKMGDYVIDGRTKITVLRNKRVSLANATNTIALSMSHHYRMASRFCASLIKRQNEAGTRMRGIGAAYVTRGMARRGGRGARAGVFPEGTNQVADIAPIFDRMLFFWSDRRNPHEVQPAYSTRYAITLWYFDAQERAEALRHYKERGQPSSSK